MTPPESTRPIITLTTDFGTRDHYVGTMKGVILSICPNANIVDITHNIEPQNVLHGAFVLRHAIHWFPPNTIHVAIVDPGVGSDRRIIAAQFDQQTVIAPDNGLLTLVNQHRPATTIHEVTDSQFFQDNVSATFHGRDILSPVAAHVASGVALDQLGPATTNIHELSIPAPTPIAPNGIAGNVLYADTFGNLITNIDAEHVRAIQQVTATRTPPIGNTPPIVYINAIPIGPIRRTYSDVPTGQPLALIGSTGMLELAVNQGRAAAHFSDWPTASIQLGPSMAIE